MAALAAGALVAVATAYEPVLVAHATRPKLGTVQALTAGPPPTAIIVAWEDGTKLTYAVDDLTTVSQNAVVSRSRILDTDYAVASSNLARTQIIQQAATAMLAQANQQPQTVLALLK